MGVHSIPSRTEDWGGVSVEIMAYNRTFDKNSFECGKPELNDWLKKQASQQERSGNTRTFLAVDGPTGKVIGYYATTTYRLELDEAARAFGSGKRRYPVPAVLLARLAVDERWQGKKLGSQLLVHALRGFADASQRVGFEVVVVHAIDRSAVTFYARAGFTQFYDHELHLYMPVKDLLRTFGN